MSKRAKGESKGGKGGRGGGRGGSRSHRPRSYHTDDEWDEAPPAWHRMSREEQADLRQLLNERAHKRSYEEEAAMFKRWQRYQEQHDSGRLGDYDDYAGSSRSEHDGDTPPPPNSGSKQKHRKDSKLRKLHDNVDSLEAALQTSKREQQRLSIELEQFKLFAMAKFERQGTEAGTRTDDPEATIQVSKAEWEELQNSARRIAKERTPEPTKVVFAKGSGKSATVLRFNYEEEPEADNASSANSSASSIAEVLRAKLRLADEQRPLRDGEYKLSPSNRSVAEKLARQLAKYFEESDYEMLDAIREELVLKTTAKRVQTLLEAMLKAIVNRKVKLEPDELLPQDT